MLSATLIAAAATVAFAFTSGTAAGAATPASHHDPDANVRINQIQTVGTHNSYHVENTDQEKAVRDAIRPNTGHGAEQYTHIPLQQQLSQQKVRQVELDLVRDPDGGRFANPLLRRLTKAGPWFPGVMNQPGIKILHEEDVDYRTNCLTFVSCLSQIRSWTQRHPGAIPITILLQFDDGAGPTFPPYTTQPLLPWTKDAMVEAEHEVLSVFPRKQIITPDDVRQPGLTLHQSVLQNDWPTLAQSRGKVLFGMDNDRDAYVAGNPNLEGRLFFTNTQNALDADDAAFVIRDNPTTLEAQIQSLVKEGMLIRSRADTPEVQAMSGDTTRRDDAFASGAQFVSTDYPVPGMARRWGTDYFAALPGSLVAQCNPLNAPSFCQSGLLDRADDQDGNAQ
jgi:calcium-dependent phosphoinositide phospholipase C